MVYKYKLVVPVRGFRDFTISYYRVPGDFGHLNVVMESKSEYTSGRLTLNSILLSDIVEKMETVRNCLRAKLTSKKMFIRSLVNRYYALEDAFIREQGLFIDVISPPVNVRDDGHIIIYLHDFEQVNKSDAGTQLIHEAVKIPGKSESGIVLDYFMS